MNNQENKYELIKFEDGDFTLDVNVSPEEDTVWLTQKEIAILFNKSRKTITEHIGNIFKEFELDKNQVCRNSQHTALDGKKYNVTFYTFDSAPISSQDISKFKVSHDIEVKRTSVIHDR